MERGTILQTATHRYEIGDCLGRGAQGSVYKAVRQDGFAVAIKLLRELTAEGLRRLRTEAWTYQRFTEHFVNLLDWRLDCARPFLVLEFCVHGSARSQMNYLSTWHSITVPLLAQAAGALQELHRHGFLYRDFKPENLLITQQGFGPWVAKLGDAGLICLPHQLNLIQMTQLVRGTPQYMAPELSLPGALYSQAAESFAFGVTAHELLSGTRPTAGTRVSVGPLDVQALLTKMVARDPTARPSLAEARAQLEIASQNLKQRNRGIAVVALVAIGIALAVGISKAE